MSGWIAVDLDGTLAHYGGWNGGQVIGEPVPLMAERVRRWLEEGKDVRIFTARVGISEGLFNSDGQEASRTFAEEQRALIQDWTEKHFGVRLRVTAVKDFACCEIWDDRAVRVVMNTGEIGLPVGCD